MNNIEYYASKIKEEWVRDRALEQATEMRVALESGKNVKDILDQHQGEMVKLHGGLTTLGGAVHISEPVAEAMERLKKLKEGDVSGLGVKTGVPVLDDKFSFLAPKNVYVVAGGVSAGKSALSDQIADAVAQQGKNVYISCLEMSAMQRAERFLARRGRVSLRAFQAHEYLSSEAESRLTAAARSLPSRQSTLMMGAA